MVATRDGHKAGRTDWHAEVYIDDRCDVFRFHIGTRRFPTAPLACAWVTRKLAGTVPAEPDQLAWGSIQQYRWTRAAFWDDDCGLVVDAEAEPVEDSASHAWRTSNGRVIWDDDADPGSAR
jgi:hypothetical protein